MIKTVKGSLYDFDKLYFAYRAEIVYERTVDKVLKRTTYKFWKEYGICRRLERFEENRFEPAQINRYVFTGDERRDLPEELWDSDDWTIWCLNLNTVVA